MSKKPKKADKDMPKDTLTISSKAPKPVDMELYMMNQKPIFEERLKVIIAIILIILFVFLFIGIAWYFLTQVDVAIVNSNNTSSSAAVISPFLKYHFIN